MNTLDTINRGNHIISYDFVDNYEESLYDDYAIIDIEEDEINYD
jgi:hypothetical protein